jgi:hypothetical protein
MTKEKYISLELAKLAKEKDFDIHINGYYIEYLKTTEHYNEGDVIVDYSYGWNSEFSISDYYAMYSRPTLELLKLWVMERYNVFVTSVPVQVNGVTSFDYQLYYDFNEDLDKKVDSFSNMGILFNSYQEAIEAGLTYVLSYVR